MLSKKKYFLLFIFQLLYLKVAFADDCPLVISDKTITSCETTTTNNTLRINTDGGLETNIPAGPHDNISVNNNMVSIVNNGAIKTFVDSGTGINGIIINYGFILDSLINNGDIEITGNSANNLSGIRVTAGGGTAITSLINNGTIKAQTVTGINAHAIRIDDPGSITNLTNNNLIIGGIANFSFGGITALNNSQGGSSPLLFDGELPSNYSIIINDSTHYGKLSINPGYSLPAFGSMNFDIFPGAIITANKYNSVLSGLLSTDISSLIGHYGGLSWELSETTAGSGIWDLLFPDFVSGPSASDTQSSLTRLAPRLRGSFNSVSAMANFPTSNTYDCNLFDVKGMCISTGGRYSTVDNPSSNSTAAVVTLGYKVSPNIRIGGFLDQSVTNNTPTGIDISNKNPMMGGFLYWNQNADGLGYQVKVANAYQDKDLSTIRDVIGTSEAGRGNTSLNTRSYVSELSYAFMYKENTLVRPYFALRHTSIEQDAYTETGIATPLTYSALNDRTTSALMGVKFKHALTPKTNLIGSLGLEQDLHNKTDRLTATGVSGLTSENFSGDIHRTRPVASLGATYDIAKTQRLAGEVLVQQLPFQNTTGATAYFNYMIGF